MDTGAARCPLPAAGSTRFRHDGVRPRRAALIAGLILAAGGGTRFGARSKLLAELGGRPLLEHAIRAQCAVAELERVVVVLGAHRDELLQHVDFGRAEPLVCERWHEGQAASLRCGAETLSAATKVIVTLGDQPLISPELIARMLGEPPGSRAAYFRRPGHPVVLGAEHLQDLAELEGDRGARDLLLGGPQIECSDLGSDRDIDTPADLRELRDVAQRLSR